MLSSRQQPMAFKTTGRFITFDAGEGVGKSTQSKLLVEALRSRGIRVTSTREPGGTSGAEALRSLLLNPAMKWEARAEALLFAAARSDHVEHLIMPALKRGDWVICDRFIDSSRAYQGGAGGIGDKAIIALHEIGTDGLLPDLTILLDLDPQLADSRANARDNGAPDRIGAKGADYHEQVRQQFHRMAEHEPKRFAIVPAHGTAEEVHERVMRVVIPLISQ